MPIDIHGKKYYTVAERLKEAHKSGNLFSITTEYITHPTKVICKATVTLLQATLEDGSPNFQATKDKREEFRVFTGTSAADPEKTIEKHSPYEVAETSAVGRALAFAGFKVTDDIASADEMMKQEEETFPASMYQLNTAVEVLQKLIGIETEDEQRTKLENIIKGFEQAKQGKREITKAYADSIIIRARIKFTEKLAQIEE